MATRLILKQAGGSTKGRGETCRQLRQDRGPTCKQVRHRRQIGIEPIGKRAIGILSILQGRTTCDKNSQKLGPVSVAWRKTSRQPTGGVNSTPTNTARTELHSMITFHRVAQELQNSGLHIFVSLKQMSSTCHLSFLAAPDTDHKHKFSLTHFIHLSYLSDSLSFTISTRSILPCEVPRQSGGSTRIPSLTPLCAQRAHVPA